MVLASALITQIRTVADMTNSTFITDTEIINFINKAYAELYNIFTSTSEEYFVSSATIPLVSGTQDYSLPSDFYKLLGIDYVVSANNNISLKPFNFNDRNKGNIETILYNSYSDYNYCYILFGTKVRLCPVPGSGSIKIWYTPQPTLATTTASAVDIIVPNMDQYIILSSAIDCLNKEESDTKVLSNQLQILRQQLTTASQPRSKGLPQTITDTSSINYWSF